MILVGIYGKKWSKREQVGFLWECLMWNAMDKNGILFHSKKKRAARRSRSFIQYIIICYLSLKMVRLPW